MDNLKSKLWESITTSLFNDINEDFLLNFRKPGGPNNRLASWDPYDPSMRHFKFLLYNVVKNKSKNFFEYYSKLSNTQVGDPTIITFNKNNIDIDYLLSVEEFIFLNENLEFNKIKTITEIGAGFGRTCHTLLSLNPHIEKYIIIDLPEILNLSKLFLSKVIPECFNKVEFISNEDINTLSPISSDLTINIDSFQEMSPSVIDFYINNIVSNSKYFYVKNPIGKYSPENVGLLNISQDKLLDVYSLGYCQEVYDLFNEDELNIGREKYCKLYCPNNDWILINSSPIDIFPYYHNALYGKK